MNRSIGVGIHRVINPTSRKKNRAMFRFGEEVSHASRSPMLLRNITGVPWNLFMSTGRRSSAGGLPNAEA
jgi:hypothetical protein